MAKLEQTRNDDFYKLLARIEHGILNGSVSASLEEQSDFSKDGVHCAVRVFERYSYIGANRLSLSVTLLEVGGTVFLSAITAGGSQALFFKLNTFGEEAFLDCLKEILY